MKLNTIIYVRGTRIEYGFNPKAGVHTLWFSSQCKTVESKVAGHIISALQPYRELSSVVRELVSWLSGFNLDGGWCPR